MKLDFLIIGQGLAGSALALELLRQGRRIRVVDRTDALSSSRVAPGLVTPLSGKGINPAWRQIQYLEYAKKFYQEVEKEFSIKIYQKTPVIRIFQTKKEEKKWESKKNELKKWARKKQVHQDLFKHQYGSLEMPEGAWLNTQKYLKVVRKKLISLDSFLDANFSYHEVDLKKNQVHWHGLKPKKIILCQGAYGLNGIAEKDAWFTRISHRCAKGEILTARINKIDQSKRFHASGWLAPRGAGIWKIGSNYNWSDLNNLPTESGKNDILKMIGTWLDYKKVKIEIINHEAGIRPIIRKSIPVIGFHPEHREIGFFNGLGSKGTLMAPAVAAHFASHLCAQCELDHELDLANLKHQ